MRKVNIEISADGDPMFHDIAVEMRSMPSVRSKDAKISLRKSCIGLTYRGAKFYLVRDISELRKEQSSDLPPILTGCSCKSCKYNHNGQHCLNGAISIDKSAKCDKYSVGTAYAASDVGEGRPPHEAVLYGTEIAKLFKQFKAEDPSFHIKGRHMASGAMNMLTVCGTKVQVKDSFAASTIDGHDAQFGAVNHITKKPALELIINGKNTSLTWGEGAELAQALINAITMGFFG